MDTLYQTIEDNVKHLKIIQNSDLIEKTSSRFKQFHDILIKIFEFKEQTIECVLVRYRILLEDSNILQILRK